MYSYILKDMEHAKKVESHPYQIVFPPLEFGTEIIATMVPNEFLPNSEHEPKRINIVVVDFKTMVIEVVNYFSNMSVISLYCSGTLRNESITIAKLLSGYMLISIQ